MRRFVKMGVVALLFWLLCGLAVWFGVQPATTLVGARASARVTLPALQLDAQGIGESLAILEKNPLWGVQRDGRPALPPPPKEVQEKKIAWSVVATILQKDEKFVLLQVENETPKPVKMGEAFPDGSKLLKVLPNAYTVEIEADGKKSVMTYFIANGK